MRLNSTSRNDTDDFFALFLIESMDDQQNRTWAYGSKGYPPLLIFRSEVTLGKSIGIIENEHGRFKANIVLPKVCRFFCSSHSNRITWSPPRQHMASSYTCQYICTYIAPQYEPGPASSRNRALLKALCLVKTSSNAKIAMAPRCYGGTRLGE
jgi:hypothetical protein